AQDNKDPKARWAFGPVGRPLRLLPSGLYRRLWHLTRSARRGWRTRAAPAANGARHAWHWPRGLAGSAVWQYRRSGIGARFTAGPALALEGPNCCWIALSLAQARPGTLWPARSRDAGGPSRPGAITPRAAVGPWGRATRGASGKRHTFAPRCARG